MGGVRKTYGINTEHQFFCGSAKKTEKRKRRKKNKGGELKHGKSGMEKGHTKKRRNRLLKIYLSKPEAKN